MAQAHRVANSAEIVCALALDQSQLLLGHLLIVSVNTFVFKTWQAFLFVREPAAYVATCENLIARLCDLLDTVGLTAAVMESRVFVIVLLLDFDCAEAALTGVLV